MANGFIAGAKSVGKYIHYITFLALKLIDLMQASLSMSLNHWSSGRMVKGILQRYVCKFEMLTWPLLLPSQQLKRAGKACYDKKGVPPGLIVVVLPEGGNDIYTAVKKWATYLPFVSFPHTLSSFSFGDAVVSTTPCLFLLISYVGAQMGVATQCLKSSKCNRAKIQYWANVMLKWVLSFPWYWFSLVLTEVQGQCQIGWNQLCFTWLASSWPSPAHCRHG